LIRLSELRSVVPRITEIKSSYRIGREIYGPNIRPKSRVRSALGSHCQKESVEIELAIPANGLGSAKSPFLIPSV
jgi:hypothetical protein